MTAFAQGGRMVVLAGKGWLAHPVFLASRFSSVYAVPQSSLNIEERK